jgi:hypothetical protein
VCPWLSCGAHWFSHPARDAREAKLADYDATLKLLLSHGAAGVGTRAWTVKVWRTARFGLLAAW